MPRICNAKWHSCGRSCVAYLPGRWRFRPASRSRATALVISGCAFAATEATDPAVPAANVVGEIVGSELPNEVIVIGGHLDSWDLGQGAHDDGGGCVIAMEAIHVLRKLGMVPRRTIRVVLFTNEENGLRGGKAYAKDHADELA
ncbi:MAG: M20/M25/M40 family metallo-hydrolase, partial [Chloroflexi bacterium]|nr:M20/M25/M40 family metallo-hydrolase [Chloroflexota bacterium]